MSEFKNVSMEITNFITNELNSLLVRCCDWMKKTTPVTDPIQNGFILLVSIMILVPFVLGCVITFMYFKTQSKEKVVEEIMNEEPKKSSTSTKDTTTNTKWLDALIDITAITFLAIATFNNFLVQKITMLQNSRHTKNGVVLKKYEYKLPVFPYKIKILKKE
jgi:hypothetical protein